jgi:hypothetical protein
MAKQHSHELIPAPKTPRMSFCFRFCDGLFESYSRKNLEQLIQNAAKSLHGADSFD